MGAGNITVLFYGVPLRDIQADAAYAFHHWWDDGRPTTMPGDEPRTSPLFPRRPHEPQSGRHWIGVGIGRCDMLPKTMRDRVYTADEASAAIDLPHADIGEARASWEHFAAWCKRRGVDLGTGGLYVVADYD